MQKDIAGARIHSAELFLQAARPRTYDLLHDEEELERERIIVQVCHCQQMAASKADYHLKGIENLEETLSDQKRRNQLLQSEVDSWMERCADLDMSLSAAMDQLSATESRVIVIVCFPRWFSA